MQPSNEGDLPSLEILESRARVFLRRPEKRNRLGPTDLEAIMAHLGVVEADPSVRSLTIEADGPSWCSGYHLGALAEGQRARFGFGEVCDALAKVAVPTIAVIKGNVHGGGTDFALACDLRLASSGVVLAMPATRIGLQYYATGLERFVQRVGPSATKRIFLTGETIGTDELLNMGYLTEVVDAEELDSRVHELCGVISELAPDAVKLTKQAIDNLAGTDADLDKIQQNHVLTTRSADHREAMHAMREGRSPRFGES
ncbi:MAG: enoyl-CoA hydratase/isomerase family protein [Actinomycetota bacterium]|nr:enoyl-CoA hydratase/isomerase family protein [Actinomycetota bacterium]